MSQSHGKVSPMTQAVMSRSTARVLALLNAGSPADQRDSDGATPLMEAVIQGNSECVHLLLAHGADVNARNDLGWTALHFCAQEGQAALIPVLLGAGAEQNARDRHGRTPLSIATRARKRRDEVLESLFRAGPIRPDTQSVDSVLEDARRQGDDGLVAVLQRLSTI